MRKIISILVALGLLLSFSTLAAPTAGAACTASVTLNPPTACAGALTTYTVNLTLPVTLAPGDLLSFEFGGATTFGTFADGEVTVDGHGVLAADVDASGAPSLNVKIPAAAGMLFAGTSILVVIPKVTNPAADDYELVLDYKESCCDPEVFDCADYTIYPATSTYGWVWDSSPMYDGLLPGFIPPFKACGQNVSMGATPVHLFDGKYANPFDLILKPTHVGCAGPCTLNVTFTLWLDAAPPGAKVSLGLNTTTGITHNLTLTDPVTVVTVSNFTLGNNDTLLWNNTIHFDLVGHYELCVKVWCPPGAGSCDTGCDPAGFTIAEECFPIEVYQWKDAFKIELDPKWNLISLPLFPFNTDIVALLGSMNASDQLMSVWYYDQCADPDPAIGDWLTDPGDGSGDLDTIEAGKSYWLRMKHPGDTGYVASKFPVSLWVWGTHAPMPPADPMAVFDVCEGFNMVGFKAPWIAGLPVTEFDEDYLWSFIGFAAQPDYGVLYSWDSSVQDWLWNYPYGETMTPGVGYWIAFNHDGQIYPKP